MIAEIMLYANEEVFVVRSQRPKYMQWMSELLLRPKVKETHWREVTRERSRDDRNTDDCDRNDRAKTEKKQRWSWSKSETNQSKGIPRLDWRKRNRHNNKHNKTHLGQVKQNRRKPKPEIRSETNEIACGSKKNLLFQWIPGLWLLQKL